MKRCAKCGMPIKKEKDFCNGDEKHPLCVHCCPKVSDKEMKDPSQGNLG